MSFFLTVLTLTSSIAEAGATGVGGNLITNEDGRVSPRLYESGSYMVSVKAVGYLPSAISTDVEAGCHNASIPIRLGLQHTPENMTEDNFCNQTTLDISVMDAMTGSPAKDATVNVLLGVRATFIS